MEYAKNSNCRLRNGVGGDIRRAIDDAFACPGSSTHAPTGRKVEQATGGSGYPDAQRNVGSRRSLDRSDDLQRKPHTVLERTAVTIRAPVEEGRSEGSQQVVMGNLDLDAI